MNEFPKIPDIGNLFGTNTAVKESEDKKPKAKVGKKDDKNMLGFLNSKMREMETEYDLDEHLVIDLGHAFTKIGFSGENSPFLIEPSIYSTLKELNKKDEITFEAKYLYGYEIFQSKVRHLYDVKYLNPGSHRTSIDHEFLDFLKVKLYSKLDPNKSVSDYYVLVNTPPIKNDDNIWKVCNILLDDMGFKGVAIMNSASLSLFSTGRTSGVVIECGEERTFTVPIFEGYPLYHALNKNKIGGRYLTDILSSNIESEHIRRDDIETVRKIKHRMLSVPYLHNYEYYINGDNDIIPIEKSLYKLPDETIIQIPKQARLQAAEFLFK
jgi:actin